MLERIVSLPLVSASAALLFSLSVVGCSDDGASTHDGGPADGRVEASVDATSPDKGRDTGPACSHDGFATATQAAERDDGLGVFFFTGRTAGTTTFDVLTVDFYFKLGAKEGAQTLVGSGENLADCHSCVMLRRGCVASGCAKAQAFLWQSGTLQIDAMGAKGTTFSGSLKGATFAEVTIDTTTQRTTLVPNGETWCLSTLAFSAPVTTP